MSAYEFDHVHILTKNPKAVADYFQRVFDGKVFETLQSDGQTRIDVDLNGLMIFIMPVAPGDDLPASPPGRYMGLDHFGLKVKNLDEAAAELKRRGAEFVVEPYVPRPGLKISFIRGPENVWIEVLERS
jgi:catechol 2,3-dioxygenase-like lactoylglutathione lyase family enzyme